MKTGLGLIIVSAFWLCSQALGQTPQSALEHHGFKIDTSEIVGKENLDIVLAALKKQIEIVEAVGLSDERMKFFRSVPIAMLTSTDGTPGLYSFKKNRVLLRSIDLAPSKPILLHEMLHAFHDQILPDGVKNTDVIRFYQLALTRYRMNKSEYFLSNEREFFAVTASIYLYGSIKRPPYDRKTIQSAQPMFWKCLEGLFGKREP